LGATTYYMMGNFRDLVDFSSSFEALISHANSREQVSNLPNISQRRATNRRVVQSFINVVENIHEIGIVTKTVSLRDDFAAFGLADAAWLEYLSEDTLLLSADEALVNYAKALGKKAEFFCPSGQ
jgi:hypothetical protein